eukprot:11121763-Lingulodinium_polyedra.AAC.1
MRKWSPALRKGLVARERHSLVREQTTSLSGEGVEREVRPQRAPRLEVRRARDQIGARHV